MSELQNNPFISFIDFNKNHPLADNLQPAYYQLGFICSVQAVPEMIDLESWLVYLWRDNEISFDNETQATEYAQTVLNIISEVTGSYQQAIPLDQLNDLQWLNEQQLSEDAVMFASGFLAAVEVFNAEWLLVEGEESIQHLLQTTVLLLTKLTKNESTPAELLVIFEQLPEIEEILKTLPSLISHLAYSAEQHSH